MAKAKLEYRGKEPVGYVPPQLDQNNEEWLIPPRLTSILEPGVNHVFAPGEEFALDEIRDRHALAFLRTCPEFKLLETTYQYGR